MYLSFWTVGTSLLIVGALEAVAYAFRNATRDEYKVSPRPQAIKFTETPPVPLYKHRKLSIDDLKSMGIKIEEQQDNE